MDDGLLDIERQRRQRMEENARRMRELGLEHNVIEKELEARQAAKAARAAKRPRERRVVSTQEARRSGRIRHLPAVVYEIDEDVLERRCRAPTKGGSKRGSQGRRSAATLSVTGYRDGWHVGRGLASDAAEKAATDACVAKQVEMAQAGVCARTKLLTESQVSGGFWEQLPQGIHRKYGHTSKVDITLHCDDDRHIDGFRYAKPGSASQWKVVYLPRPSGAGLSGGWRGFAIDQRLAPNDAVLFEHMDPLNLRVHLFRANDYESDATRGGPGYIAPRCGARAMTSEAAGGAPATPPSPTAAADTAAHAEPSDDATGGARSGSPPPPAPRAAAPRVRGSRGRAASNAAACGVPHAAAEGATGGASRPPLRERNASVPAATAGHAPPGRVQKRQLPAGAAGAPPPTRSKRSAREGGEGRGVKKRAARGDAPAAKRARATQAAGAGDEARPSSRADAAEGAAPRRGRCISAVNKYEESAAAAAGDKPRARGVGSVGGGGGGGGGGADGSAAAAACKAAKGAGAAKTGGAARSAPPGVQPPSEARAAEGEGAREEGQEEENEDGLDEDGLDKYEREEARLAAQGIVKVWERTEEERRLEASSEDFWVTKILECRKCRNRWEFKVRWYGFSPAWDTWEPRESLNAAPHTYVWANGVKIPKAVLAMP